MAEAANLTVTISGDASGLVGAVNEAQSSLAALENSANVLAGLDGTSVAFDITANDNATGAVNAAKSAIEGISSMTAQAEITAVDNTADGVASAQAAINSVQGKTVTITVNYQVNGKPEGLAKGTKNAPEGLAMINDERGISDPRELVYHDGQYMMFSGRDVVLPLSKGDIVYTAEETKSILKNIPRYKKGKYTSGFEADKTAFTHLKKISNVPIASQIDFWKEAMEKYASDSEAVEECSEEIFSLTRKLADNLNSLSESYAADRAYLNDFESFGDTAIEAFDRIRDRNAENLHSGLITWEEYTENMSGIGSKMYNERLVQSKRWLKQESKYNNLSTEDYIAGLERMKAYTAEYYAHGIISYKEYADNMQDLSNAVADKEAEGHKAVYDKWLSSAKNWKKMRDTYDDWEDYGDSQVKYYERCIERIDELYQNGHISWQKYRDETMNYSMDLYNAQLDEVNDLLNAQSAYIGRVKLQFTEKENALKKSWETDDRAEDLSETKRLLAIYKNAVTEKGKNKYSDLQEQLKKLEREEQLYRLQKSNNQKLASLESDYKLMEANKKLLLTSIQNSGIDVCGLIDGINRETSGMQSVMTNLASKIIAAINSKSTYSDNRNISISTSDSSVIRQFTKKAEYKIARGRYY